MKENNVSKIRINRYLSKKVLLTIINILLIGSIIFEGYLLLGMGINSFVVIFGGITLSIFFGYGLKRGTTSVSYTQKIVVKNAHSVSFLSIWGILSDNFHLIIDNENIFSGSTSLFKRSGSHQFRIDDKPIMLHWRWHSFWGDPVYIFLEWNGQVIAHYGDHKAISKLSSIINRDNSFSNPLFQARLIREISSNEEVHIVSEEEYPIDNRFGSDIVTIEQEISKTFSNMMTCESTNLVKMGISIDVLKIITGQISLDLTNRFNISFGETTTKRHTFRFSVQPKSYIVYKVVWTNRVRNGSYLLTLDGERMVLPYQASFGMSYNLTSLLGEQQSAQ